MMGRKGSPKAEGREFYQRKADECISSAEEIKDPVLKVSLLELAALWRRMAAFREEQAERSFVRAFAGKDSSQQASASKH
jgi:hypothetical protein